MLFSRFASLLLVPLLASAALVGGPAATATTSERASTALSGVTLEWGLNGQAQGASQNGGCDYFAAGRGDGSASSYSAASGGVRVITRLADGTSSPAAWTSRCAALGVNGAIGQRMQFTGGSGERGADGSMTASWNGTVTVNSYNGLVPWFLIDPVLTVDADGSGTLVADVGGYFADEDNPAVKVLLDDVADITVATFSKVAIDDEGLITMAPDYVGVDYFPLNDDGTRGASAIPDEVKASAPDTWGAWPTPFVDFQYTTGLSRYWHHSGLAGDVKKAPLPISISIAEEVQAAPVFGAQPLDATVSEGATVMFSVTATDADDIEWQRLDGEEWTTVPSEGTTLRLAQVTVPDHDGSRYRAVATGPGGRTVSSTATLTVVEREQVVITSAPPTASVEAGSQLYVTVSATGSTLSYRWEQSFDGGASWQTVGTSRILYRIFDIDSDGTLLRAVVTNGVDAEVATAPIPLSVVSLAPSITVDPLDRVAVTGSQITLSASATGVPTPTWVWEKSTDGGGTWNVVKTASSATRTTLSIADIAASQDGEMYRATARNAYGDPAISRVSTLTVHDRTGAAVGVTVPGRIDQDTIVFPYVGAGFTSSDPGDGAVYAGIVPASAAAEIFETRDTDAFTGAQFSTWQAASLAGTGQMRAATLTLPGGSLRVDTLYEFVTFSSDPTRTAFDTRTPLVLPGQSVPALPTGLTARAGSDHVTLSWDADDAGLPTTGYTIIVTGPTGVVVTRSVEGITATIDGLDRATDYSATLVASNALGDSAPTTPIAFRTLAAAPSAPAAPSLSAGPTAEALIVTWQAPADDGGSEITSYTVTLSASAGVLDEIVVPATRLDTTVTGLRAGRYSATITATNAAGSATSAASDSFVLSVSETPDDDPDGTETEPASPETTPPAPPTGTLNGPAGTSVGSADLAATGADSAGIALIGASLLIGGLIVVMRRRRKTTTGGRGRGIMC